MSNDPFMPVVSPDPEASSSGNSRTVVIVVGAVVGALILVIAVIGAVWALNRDGGGVSAGASATPTPEESVSPSPTPTPEQSPSPSPTSEVDRPAPSPPPAPDARRPQPSPPPSPESERPSVAPDEDALARAEALGFSPVAHEMEIDDIHHYYAELQESGELHQGLIPATQEGAEYVHAFMLILTDHMLAYQLGAPFDGESRDEIAALELKFLAVADMDVNIWIKDLEGQVFEHDGTAPKPVN